MNPERTVNISAAYIAEVSTTRIPYYIIDVSHHPRPAISLLRLFKEETVLVAGTPDDIKEDIYVIEMFDHIPMYYSNINNGGSDSERTSKAGESCKLCIKIEERCRTGWW